MVANLSAHDIRRLFSNTESFGKLGQPVKDALELCSPKFTCTAADSLASVITQLVDNHIHRVYITDESGRVEGVLSLREVIAQFVREPEESELNKYFATQ
jgi:CBS domain-containing protein